jgi:hypothetical protein
MRGTELCEQVRRVPVGSLPGIFLRRRRIIAPQRTCWPDLPGTEASRRPFTRRQRLLLSKPPLTGRRSRPAALASHRISTRSVRLTAPPPRPFPARVGLNAVHPLPGFHPAPPTSPRLPLPFGTFRPLRIKAFRRFVAGKPAFRSRPFAVRSPGPLLLGRGFGSSFPARYVSGGPPPCCYYEPTPF